MGSLKNNLNRTKMSKKRKVGAEGRTERGSMLVVDGDQPLSDPQLISTVILHSPASSATKEMCHLLTTQGQNCYREQIQKEMLTRLAWKSRYADLYPTCHNSTEPIQLPRRPAEPPSCGHAPPTRVVLPPVSRTAEKQSALPPPPPPPVLSLDGEGSLSVPPQMRPVSPQTRDTLYQDSSHHGKGRSLYLQRRGHIRPEEKFDFPLLSSWEYGWRLGDYTLDYRTPSCAKSSVVKKTFYARNGVFSCPSATDTLG